jgi:DNA helicase HerA-like ATPase
MIEWLLDFFREDSPVQATRKVQRKTTIKSPVITNQPPAFQYPLLKIGTASNLKKFAIDTEDFKDSGMRIGIFAQSGAGKSNTTGVIVEELLKQKELVIIFDFEGEWHGLRSMFGTIMVVGGDSGTVEIGHDPDDSLSEEDIYGVPVDELEDGELPKPGLNSRFEKILTNILTEGVSAVFDLSDFQDNHKRMLFSAIADCLFRIQQKLKTTVLVVVDEAAVVAPEENESKSAGRLKSSTSVAIALASRGRKRAIDVLWASQRTSKVSKTVIGQCDMFFFGKVSIEHDFKPIKHFVTAAGITFEDLKKLNKGQFYCVFRGVSTLVNVRKMICEHKGSTPERVKRKRASESDVAMIERRLS